MTQVYLDSQLIEFNGPIPSNLAELISLVTNILEQENRYFTGISVDSYKTVDQSLLEKSLDNFQIIKLISSSEYSFLSQLIKQNKETINNLINLFPKIAGQILVISIKDTLCLLNTYLQDIQFLLDGLKHMRLWSKENAKGQENVIDLLCNDYKNFLQKVEQSLSLRDIGMLSEIMSDISLFDNHLHFLNEFPLRNDN